MWYCNGDPDGGDCCSVFEEPNIERDRWGCIVFTCPFCGAIAEPADEDGEEMLHEIIDEVI